MNSPYSLPSMHLLFLLFYGAASAAEIRNGIKGLPTVTCGEDAIIMQIDSEKPFTGNVYTKGFFEDEKCTVQGTRRSSTEIRVPLTSECGTRRRRMVSPRGLLLDVTIIVMFHRLFLTKIDRSYHVECFYVQYDETVSQSYDVSILPSVDLKSSNLNEDLQARTSAAVPSCKYEVLHGGPTGSALKYGKIGDVVYHKWTCTQSEGMCMTVHSCVVDDGRGRGQQLIDERGCTRDSFILDNLLYPSHLEAGQSSTVFRFADRTTVFFSCQIRLERVADTADNCAHDFSCGDSSEGASRSIDAPVRFKGAIEKNFPRPIPLPIQDGHSDEYFEDTAVEVERNEKGEDARSIGGIATELNQSDFPAPGSLDSSDSSIESPGYFVRRETTGRKRKRTYGLGRDPLHKPLKFFDLIDTDEENRSRFRRSPSADSMEIDVSTESIEVSDEPLFENVRPLPDVARGDIYVDDRGEVCMSTLAFSMFILTTVLIIAIISMIYWIYAFRRTGTSGRITRFVENYWIETEASNQNQYRYSKP
ncbi:cutl-4 [Pristionchus pacificus]|uniref:Cutl-4 n=1 Tax=Pristionchus pacificus TaxID=54126 RepID=A0A2A6CRQ5_PRIPA|nr:cutl-4 [Pristionchus pacificus]|eukprot:PDM80800.1 cutl-4 [Pristionchus pacificus]